MTLTHHDLCFGCGLANLFGLQLEAGDGDAVTGRFFVKQDHQGPPGFAHGGIVATALDEAMALLVHAEGLDARTRRLEVEFFAPAPVGSFCFVRAAVAERLVDSVDVQSELYADEAMEERPLARASGFFRIVAD